MITQSIATVATAQSNKMDRVDDELAMKAPAHEEPEWWHEEFDRSSSFECLPPETPALNTGESSWKLPEEEDDAGVHSY